MKQFFKAESPVNNQRGMALLITITIISMLIAVTVMFFKRSWHSYLVANNYKVITQLRFIADSGINIGREIITDKGKAPNYTTLLDGWATLAKDECASLFGYGKLELVITDLSGRLPINGLVQNGAAGGAVNRGNANNAAVKLRKVLFRLLLSGKFGIEEQGEAGSIVDALVDWLDKDDRESDNGAESSYYQSLARPYACRNGPVENIEELLLVKGITAKLLFGGRKTKALADYITVYGMDGKININTADKLLIKSMDSQISSELVEKLDLFRRDKDNLNQLAKTRWYLNTGFWPGDIKLNERYITTQSVFFHIKAVGRRDRLLSKVQVVVRRTNDNTLELLSKKVD